MVENAKSRKTFGTALADRQGIRWMIADSALELELGRALVWNKEDKMERAEPIGSAASLCNLHCSEMVGRIVDCAVQIYGGLGIVNALPFAGFYREVRFVRWHEGVTQTQHLHNELIGTTT